MGRHCGYLALMSAIAGGADYVLIPEQPPAADWHAHMAGVLRRARDAGRRTSIVVVAEGAADAGRQPDHRRGRPQGAVADEMGEDARVTILGHVQRGGRPERLRPLDGRRCVGHAATAEVLRADREPQVIGVRRQPTHRAVAGGRRGAPPATWRP